MVRFLEYLHIFLPIKSDYFAIPFISKYFRKIYTFSFSSKRVFRANQYHLLVMKPSSSVLNPDFDG